MNCQEARDSLSMLLDGNIGLTERVPLELHVNSCEGCQRRLVHLQELRELEQRPRPMPRRIQWRPIQWRPIHWLPVHWRPFLAPGFVEKALGVMRAEDVTIRLRRLVAEKVPSRQLALAAAIPLVVMVAALVFERGFIVGSTMHQRPVAPLESMSDTPVAPLAASIAPSSPAVLKPVVPEPVAPPPAPVDQPATPPPAAMTTPALPPPSVATPPAPPTPAPSLDQARSVETQVAAAKATEAKAIDAKGASKAARSESMAKDEKTSAPAVTKSDPAKASTATNGSSEANRKFAAAVKPTTDAHPSIKASETVASSRRGMVDVVGRLQVKTRSDAERDVAALFERAGGTAVSRQEGPSVTVLEGGIPHANYGTFAQGIMRIGSLRLEAERSPLPDIVQVSVRVAE